jgi:hypothetical protein
MHLHDKRVHDGLVLRCCEDAFLHRALRHQAVAEHHALLPDAMHAIHGLYVSVYVCMYVCISMYVCMCVYGGPCLIKIYPHPFLSGAHPCVFMVCITASEHYLYAVFIRNTASVYTRAHVHASRGLRSESNQIISSAYAHELHTYTHTPANQLMGSNPNRTI